MSEPSTKRLGAAGMPTCQLQPSDEIQQDAMNYDQLIGQYDMISEVAFNLRGAAETLARNANGTRSHIMPAPTTYELLSHLKLALGHLNEVAAFLPQGLRNSLNNPNVTVTDRHFLTGDARDPEESVTLACQALLQFSGALTAAATYAESAQGALNSQGYEPVTN